MNEKIELCEECNKNPAEPQYWDRCEPCWNKKVKELENEAHDEDPSTAICR